MEKWWIEIEVTWREKVVTGF
uniref:Uncharacterized protein n=1 Tax=Vitis vinifera TaxID=29760 RepID=F6HA23_VITVI